MKITIYELLGMIKDGKAPKKIKIDNDILTLSKTNIIQYNFGQCGQLNWDYYIENYKLDEKVVEILDKTEEKIPEKLETLTYINRKTLSILNEHRDKINEIIDCLNNRLS